MKLIFFLFWTSYVQGEKCTQNTSTLPSLARSPPSVVPGLRPGRVHNKNKLEKKSLLHLLLNKKIFICVLYHNSQKSTNCTKVEHPLIVMPSWLGVISWAIIPSPATLHCCLQWEMISRRTSYMDTVRYTGLIWICNTMKTKPVASKKYCLHSHQVQVHKFVSNTRRYQM